MKGERIVRAAITGTALLSLYKVSNMAFGKKTRYSIFKRDGGTCQGGDCIGNYVEGQPRSHAEGWNVQAAHYPDKHQKGTDHDANNGRILCVTCHIEEEVNRDNMPAARLLRAGHTIRTFRWLTNNVQADHKAPLEAYVDLANSTEEEKPDVAKSWFSGFSLF